MPRFSLKTLLVVLTAIATACGVLVFLSPLLPYSPVIVLIAYVFFLLFGAPSIAGGISIRGRVDHFGYLAKKDTS